MQEQGPSAVYRGPLPQVDLGAGLPNRPAPAILSAFDPVESRAESPKQATWHKVAPQGILWEKLRKIPLWCVHGGRQIKGPRLQGFSCFVWVSRILGQTYGSGAERNRCRSRAIDRAPKSDDQG